MTGMWPTGVADHQHHGTQHQQQQQHMQQVAYNSSGYPVGGPLDVYGSAAAGFDGWAVAQAQAQAAAAQQYGGVGGGPLAGHQHMLPGHHMMGQHMGHAANNNSGNRNGMMMHGGWSPQHMHMPVMMHPHGGNSGSPPGGYMQQGGGSGGGRGGGGGNWQLNQKAGGVYGGGYNNGRQQSGGRGPMGGRGGRPRRHLVLNTTPGDFSDAAVEEFAAAVKRTPSDKPLDSSMVSDGLSNLDSRGLAALLKELAKEKYAKRAREVFDFLRGLPAEHNLAPLCDVFTYTAMVSLCVDNQELQRAMDLVSEMKLRRVECNVHTYTALMNVAIKSGQLHKALEVYHDMLREGCTPNVVTYNTLIDVYGKTGQWGEALRVIDTMSSSNTKPVTRTYNTLMIACNTSGQWQEALNVYNDMIRRGHQPNTTTYNALVSAYSKAGRLEKVMEVYQDMLRTGCERSVITYSALISACEKAGQWQLALNLFSEMLRERCQPNVITYNSLITACAQGAQWSKAAEVFEQMKTNNCRPDVVTYTALVSAYERGGQWMKALAAFNQMLGQNNCKADAILYNTLLDVLWDTGVPWAQQQAAMLFRVAVDDGHFRKLPMPNQPQRPYATETLLQPPGAAAAAAAAAAASEADGADGSAADSPTAAAAASGPGTRLELGMQGVSPGVAMLMLHCWLADLRAMLLQQQQQQQQQAVGLPERVMISAGRSRQRDHISGILRDSTQALLASWGSPFTYVADSSPSSSSSQVAGSTQGSNSNVSAPAATANNNNNNSNNGGGGGSNGSNSAAAAAAASNAKLEAAGTKVTEWLLQDSMQKVLAGFMQKAGGRKSGGGGSPNNSSIASSIAADLEKEGKLDKSCQDEFAAVKEFENNHCLSVQSMGAAYTSSRPALVKSVLALQDKLGLRDDVVHDAVLLMDRAMSASFKVEEDAFTRLAAACLHSVLQTASNLPKPPPSLSDICEALDCGSADEVEAEVIKELKATLKDDLASTSALRCLKLYLERLSYVFAPDGSCSKQEDIQECLELVARAASDNEFLNYRPTITAAAVLYCVRLHKGCLPFWPSSLQGLTSYSNARTPELSAAIGGAQRLWKQLLMARHPGVSVSGDGVEEGAGAEEPPAAAEGSSEGSKPASDDKSSAAVLAGDAAAVEAEVVDKTAAKLAATKV